MRSKSVQAGEKQVTRTWLTICKSRRASQMNARNRFITHLQLGFPLGLAFLDYSVDQSAYKIGSDLVSRARGRDLMRTYACDTASYLVAVFEEVPLLLERWR